MLWERKYIALIVGVPILRSVSSLDPLQIDLLLRALQIEEWRCVKALQRNNIERANSCSTFGQCFPARQDAFRNQVQLFVLEVSRIIIGITLGRRIHID